MNNQLIRSALSVAIFSAMTSLVYADEQVQQQNDAVKLETIVVTAAGYEQDVSKAPASITVITKEELETRQYNDITDVLRNTPGVVILEQVQLKLLVFVE